MKTKTKIQNSKAITANYKMTELGPLPQEWEVVRLGDGIVNITMGQSPPGETYNTDGNGFPFLQGKAEFGDKHPKHIKYTTKPQKIAPKNSILLSVRAPVGDVNIADKEYCIGRGLAAINGKQTENYFIFYYFLYNKNNIEKLGSGSTFKSINKSQIENLEIPLPPFPEQKKIAAILSTVQKAIETENKLIERTRELKKAMMHKLFTEGTRGEKQKMTEIGPVPESWEVKTIGENAQIKGGKRIPKGHKLVDEPTGYPYLRVTDFKNYSIDVSNLKFLLPETQQLIQRYTISDTDVFISIAGTIGICGMVPPNLSGANLTENAAKIVVTNKKIKPRFLMYFLSTDHAQKEIHSQTVKNAQPKLALARIASLRFPIPDLSEQQQIASILSTIDRKIEHHTTKKQKLEELFRTLLHELMTAKIRVNEVELKEVIK
jgi:type I restriction enzyme S subunit